MSPDDFIFTNIENLLIKDGYSKEIANIGASAGLEEYKRRSYSTAKGRMFDDCLSFAIRMAKLHQKKIAKAK